MVIPALRFSRFGSWALVFPATAFFFFFVFVPLCVLGIVSAYNDIAMETFGGAQYAKFFSDPYNRQVLFGTLWLALRTTALTLLIGYPLAYLYTLAPRSAQRVLLLLIVLPLLTSVVVRTFAWIVILGRQGILNSALIWSGWIDSPLTLLYTPMAVVVALVQIELPLMVLPIITALKNIDPNLTRAAETLGARKWRSFWTITVPLSLPGVLAGCLLVFASSAAAFVTQTLIGGGQYLFMPYYIYQQAIQVNNYPYAAALAVILLGSVLAVVMVVNLVSLGRRTGRLVHG